jgi:membrane protein implicated in regulation of membrane protease activity
MENYILWFLLAFGLLVLEMATGTFYMMMLAVAFGAGGLSALAGLSLSVQMTLGALVSVAGIFVLRSKKTTSSEQNLDVGETVQVIIWHDDGTARVRYRGAEWDAVPESVDMPRVGVFYIKEIQGSKLLLSCRS